MQREPFDSSVIRSASYDPTTCTREVAFHNHRIYPYLDVPPAEWIALKDESAGIYFSAHTHNAYECRSGVNLAQPQAAPL